MIEVMVRQGIRKRVASALAEEINLVDNWGK
jgi:hypothetical protein